jgi:hypothetical protein
MTAATLIGIFIVPVFYVTLQGLGNRYSTPQAQAQTPTLPAAGAGPER